MPSVPHEGLLGRLGAAILLGQSVVLAAVAVAGLLMSTTTTSPSPVRVLGLGMNLAHAVLLGITAVVGAVVCLRRRAIRFWAVTQFSVYTVVFLAGTTLSANTLDRSGLNLNGPDHALHGVLALLGFAVAMLTSARVIEPPPGPPPNDDADVGPDRGPDADERSV